MNGLALSCAVVAQECQRCSTAYTTRGKQYPTATERVKTPIRKRVCVPNLSILAAMAQASVARVLIAVAFSP